MNKFFMYWWGLINLRTTLSFSKADFVGGSSIFSFIMVIKGKV